MSCTLAIWASLFWTFILSLTTATTPPPDTTKTLHPARRFFHALNGAIAITCYHYFGRDNFLWGCMIAFIFCCCCEVLKLNYAPFREAGMKYTASIVRAHEAHKFSGVAYYVFGSWLTARIGMVLVAKIQQSPSSSSSDIVITDGGASPLEAWLFTCAVLNLAIGDPFAGMIGTALGHYKGGTTNYSCWLRVRAHGKSPLATLAVWGINTGLALIARYLIIITDSSNSNSSNDASSTSSFEICLLTAAVGALTEFLVPSPYPSLPLKRFPLGTDDNLFIAPVTLIVTVLALCF